MGHWYNKAGEPAYTIIGANGKLRDTTLRDARKLNLCPSVTTIMQMAAKPALEIYKENQLVEACYNTPLPVFEGERFYQEWKKAVIMQSRIKSKKAADRGTQIHDALEQYYLGKGLPNGEDEMLLNIVVCAVKFMMDKFGPIAWQPERSFTNLEGGFGGKVDISFTHSTGDIVLDFKTKDTDNIEKMVAYDEHGMQTAAYAVGLNIKHASRCNLFISTQIPGLLNLTQSLDFDRDIAMFNALRDFWQLRNNYVPRLS